MKTPSQNMAPPSDNMGAQNTDPDIKPSEKQRISLDWIEFTAPAEWLSNNQYKSLQTYLQIPGGVWSDVPRGRLGFPCQKTYGVDDDLVRVLYGAAPEMGVHVEISGGCLRRAKGDIPAFMHWLYHHGMKITRLDIAIDDYTGDITPEKLLRYLKNGLALSIFKTYRFIEAGTISGKYKRSVDMGKTLYFGSPASRTLIRAYDKGREQIAEFIKKGHACCPIRPWFRFEIQLRSDNAQNTAAILHESKYADLGQVASSILGKYIRILKKPSRQDSNKSRWPLADFYQKFLGRIEKIKIATEKPKFEIPRTVKWFKHQIAPSFAIVLDVLGPEKMMELYKLGKARLQGDRKLQVDFERRARQGRNVWCYTI